MPIDEIVVMDLPSTPRGQGTDTHTVPPAPTKSRVTRE